MAKVSGQASPGCAPRQPGAEFGAQPERLQCVVCWIPDPDDSAGVAKLELGWLAGDSRGGGKEAIGIYKKWTTRQTLPVLWREETFWHQMVRLIVQAAVEERSGKFVSPDHGSRVLCESLNPRQPSRVIHL